MRKLGITPRIWGWRQCYALAAKTIICDTPIYTTLVLPLAAQLPIQPAANGPEEAVEGVPSTWVQTTAVGYLDGTPGCCRMNQQTGTLFLSLLLPLCVYACYC